jgi:ATP adenylyltransferase
MVSPLRHTRELGDLKENEILDLFRAVVCAQRLLRMVLKPQGYNIGLNLGKSAGAGITGHLHLHIVPRWQGDTNFMSAINDTKVISQSLAQLHKRLKNAYAKTN